MGSSHHIPWAGLQLWEKPSVSAGTATVRWRFHCINVSSGPTEWSATQENQWEISAKAAGSTPGLAWRTGHLEIALSLAESETCDVQVSDPHSRGPQLLSIGPSMHICLEHRLDPMAAFHQGPHRLSSQPPCPAWPSGACAWPSCEAYAAAWHRLCFLEAVTCAVAEGDVKILGGVAVRWTASEDAGPTAMTGTFSIPCELVDAHELKIRTDDLLCIRCKAARTARATDRRELVAAVFHGLNKSGSGYLSPEEMRPFADCTGFDGDEDGWREEHAALCQELGCSATCGIDVERFTQLVNDSSEHGCFCSEVELREILAAQESSVRGGGGGGAQDADAEAPGTAPTRVVHAVVAEAERAGDELQVRFQQRAEMAGGGHLLKAGLWTDCVVELVPLGESYHCTASALRDLPGALPLVRDLVLRGRAGATGPGDPRAGGEDLSPFCLNPSQEEGVRAALSRPAVLIHGPPGTGKTRTAAALALAFARRNVARHARACVLYAASGNQAVDVAVEAISALSVQRLEDLFRTQNAESEICCICWGEGCNVITFCGHVFHHRCLTQAVRMAQGPARCCPLCRASLKSIDGVRLLRVYSSDTERLDFPVPKKHQYGGVRERRRRAVPEGMRRFALHWRVHNKVSGHHNPHAAECEAAYAALLDEGPRGLGFEKARIRYSQALEKARAFELRSCNILLVTSCSTRRDWVPKLLQQEQVELRQVVVDEAGTTTEPEMLCPLTLSRDAEHLVLVGDHRQLQPIVKSREAAALGLARSLFERLALQGEPEAVGAVAAPGAGARGGPRHAEAPGRPAAGRGALAAAAFERLDGRGVGLLGLDSLRPFADFTGFAGSPEEWREEYGLLCAALGRRPEDGLDLPAFRRIVDDESAEGCFCTDAELSELARLGTEEAEAGREAPGPETAQADPPASVLLRQQYRMHPSLNRFPSRQFYGGQVGDDVSTLERAEGLLVHPRTAERCAVFFWPGPPHFREEVQETASRDASVRSRANPLEAERCAELAEALAARAGARGVAVLSWYNAQVSALRERLRPRPRCAGLHCGSVVTAQGSEWDYVLLSTVRAEAPAERGRPQLGCLADRHLLNVAVTRGRLGIVVLGDPALLRTSRHWEAFLRHCAEVGGLLDASEKPEVLAPGGRPGAAPSAARAGPSELGGPDAPR